ncbi:thioesterase family protein [Aquisalimonas lutea]|uniref:acyl-CoA thioesterase n=1 Tax=Aquisalimonas lutea TaxID=1327750 RepID=UPI0025B38D75|nr:thioesterase family protein [Aquisalimonas lutea]MDN3519491.1 thioesterase family protein [Aquisalimonas lutea]
MATTALFRSPIRIRFGDTDPAGIVFYPRYFEFFQVAVEDWFNHWLGIDYADHILRSGNGLPAVASDCRFLHPSRLGELLEIEVRITHLGRSSLHLAFTGYVSGELRVQGHTVLVNTDLATDRSYPFTGALRQRLEAYRELSRAAADDHA